MSDRVICLSRSIASGGEEIGHRVAEQLGLRYVDEEIVARAAQKANIDVEQIGEAEHRQSLVSRILDAIGTSPVEAIGVSSAFFDPALYSGAGAAGGLPAHLAQEHYRKLIREVIGEVAEEGNVVIVAHAAAMALGGVPGVLRVLVTASRETRIERLRQGSDLGKREAAKEVTRSDKERTDYFKLFYEVRQELPTHYDVVINTDAIDLRCAAAVIVSAATGVPDP